MAALTLTIGPITSAINAGDAGAQVIIGDYIAAYGGPVNGTNQQKADWFMAQIKRHIVEAANGQSVKAARNTAEATATDAVKTRDWT